jgi:hypothetical protein
MYRGETAHNGWHYEGTRRGGLSLSEHCIEQTINA